uniref:Dimer_Tnp_hAT domain-containing protein n=1 Tax=Macrostomum lignano TaxID=282301 RepID=A0A1I8H1V1_9PLAT
MSRFLDAWLNANCFPQYATFLKKAPGDSAAAFCAVCNKKFKLSNMGKAAIDSHMRQSTHVKNATAVSSQYSVRAMLSSSQQQSQKPKDGISDTVEPSTATVTVQEQLVALQQPQQSTVLKLNYFTREAVLKAEVTWALFCVEKNYSMRSADGLPETFQDMFPDSEIAKHFSLGRDKIGYMLKFGLAPFFEQELRQNLAACTDIVVCYDEALNKITQKSQMDVHVRFWDNKRHQVQSQYLGSAFLGSTKAENLLEALESVLKNLPLSSVLQVSMDGPNVNLKTLRLLKGKISAIPESPVPVEAGTCGLHTVSRAFQCGHAATSWELNRFLRSLYRLLKDCPARRAEYISLTKANDTQFPLKFCLVRWLENSPVASRAIAILPNLKMWLRKAAVKGEGSQLMGEIRDACKDPLLSAKLQFFRSVSLLLEPFLLEFQTKKPMFVFLYEKLSVIVLTVGRLFLKPEIVTKASVSDLANLELDKAALPAKLIDIGFAARKELGVALAEKTISEQDKLKFLSECKQFYCKLIEKLLEKSPLRYPIVRGASSLSPTLICSSPEVSQQRFRMLLTDLMECHRLSADGCDLAQRSFGTFVESPEVQRTMAAFNAASERVDTLYWNLLAGAEATASVLHGLQLAARDALWKPISMVLIMSHGNATVESGFSVNKDLLVPNLLQDSLVSLRQVQDAITVAGGRKNILLSKNLLSSVRMARQRYRDALEEKRDEEKSNTAVTVSQKRKATDEIFRIEQELEAKRRALLAEETEALARVEELRKRLA